jgi:hypothetical protein
MRGRLLLGSVLVAAGCASDTGIARTTEMEEFHQAPTNQVDILWIIDTSVSMQEEQDAVATAAADFTDQLDNANMDFHLGLVTTDMDQENENAGVLLGTPAVLDASCRSNGIPSVEDDDADCTYADSFRARVQQGTEGSDQEKGMQAAIQALTAPLVDTRNYGFLREEALLMVIVLSDENDCSDFGGLGSDANGEDCYNHYEKLSPVSDLVRQMKELKGDASRVVMSGIIGPDIMANCANAVPGNRYATAISMLSGVRANICLTDYSPVMSSLGLVATGIITDFQLSKAAIEESIEVTVDPVDAAEYEPAKDETNGWTYDADYAQIDFHGTAVPAREATIYVSYEVAGLVPDPPDSGG